MKILWINGNPNPNPGGTEAHSIDFINSLEKIPEIKLYKAVAKGGYIDNHTTNKNKFYITLKSEFSPLNTLKLINITKQIKPEVVIGNNGNEYINTFLAGKLAGSKVVLFRHMLNRQPFFIKKFIFPNVDKIIAVSESSKRRLLLDSVQESKIEVLPNFIDEEKFNFNQEEKKEVREKLNIKDDEVVISFLGKVAEGKGIFDFYYVAKRLTEKSDKFRFLVIGYGRDLEKIKKMAQEDRISDKFTFTDKTNTPHIFLKASDILLALSKNEESFGRIVVEGFAVKNIVIVYDVENLKYLVKDRETGFICPVGDIDCVVSKIIKVVEDRNLFEFIKENAYNEFKENYTEEKVINRFLKIISEVVK
ncbi:MAG: glycosyltransferase family 4 protein [Hydrogenothermaceae bacterium]|nr:glycosyltransferase family 4 protein [Hydrogenothermaceae bacterium]